MRFLPCCLAPCSPTSSCPHTAGKELQGTWPRVGLLRTHSAHAPLGDPWVTVMGRAMAGMGTCRLSRAHCCLVIIYQMMEDWTVLWSCSKCSLGCGNRGHSSSHGIDLARQTVRQNVDMCWGGGTVQPGQSPLWSLERWGHHSGSKNPVWGLVR